MKSYRITIILNNGDSIIRSIAMKPRRLRKALRHAHKGANLLLRGKTETCLVFCGEVSRVYVTTTK